MTDANGSATPIVISGGRVVTPAGVVDADLVIAGERIAAVSEPGLIPGEQVDARGCFVLPGGVDPHVHLLSDVPAGDQALLGGTTTAISFTWPEDGENAVTAFERARDELLPTTSLDVGLHAALWNPEAVTGDDVARLAALGVCGIKLYLAYPELGMMASDRAVYHAMRWAREHHLPVQIHCENGGLIEALTEDALAAGRTGVREFFTTRPAIAEEEAVHRALCLAEAADADVYIVHVSTAGGTDHVRMARGRGVRVWAESCTWNLMLDESVIDLEDPRPYMAAPPVRSRAHVEAVWRALADGTLDTLGSDHHEGAYQPPGTPENFTGVGYSIRGLRVRLPMLLGEGLRRGVAIEHLVELLCGGPARVFGLPGKGRLAPGCDADVVIWDPKGSWRIGPDYPAWNGRTVPGAVRTVLRRGETVVRDGELLEPRTTGLHLPRRFTASRHQAVRMA